MDHWTCQLVSSRKEKRLFKSGLCSLSLNDEKDGTRNFSFCSSLSRKYLPSSLVVVRACSVVPDSLRPHGLCPPWDFPGKNTGVGCHFLLQPSSLNKCKRHLLNDQEWDSGIPSSQMCPGQEWPSLGGWHLEDQRQTVTKNHVQHSRQGQVPRSLWESKRSQFSAHGKGEGSFLGWHP